MRKQKETQTDTATWAGDSGGISTDLLKSGAITEIRATAEVTPSATLTGANQADGLWRVIQNLRIEGGSHTYFTLPADDACMGGTLLHYINQWDGYGLGHSDGAITAPSRLYTPVTFVYHCGSRPQDQWGRPNPFDLSALIPATLESRLRAVWVTSGNDVMDDTVTISSAIMRFTVAQVLGTMEELQAEMALQGVGLPPGALAMMPAWTAEVYAIAATASDYSLERDVPTGGWLKRILLAIQDATATRSLRAQDEVTAVAIKLPKDGTVLLRAFADQMLADFPPASVLTANSGALESGGTEKMGADFNLNAPKGILVVDLRPHASPANPWGRDYGLNLVNRATGDVKLGMTVTVNASGDDALILYENYLQVSRRFQ